MRKVAFVTGATRGIGKACALSLARAGFDIAVTGRTLKEGEGKVPSASAKDPKELPVPGSIESTVAAVRALGREALGLRLDILSRPSIDQALEEGICFAPGDVFSASRRYRHCLRLSAGYAWNDRIDAGVRRLGRLAHGLLGAELRSSPAR